MPRPHRNVANVDSGTFVANIPSEYGFVHRIFSIFRPTPIHTRHISGLINFTVFVMVNWTNNSRLFFVFQGLSGYKLKAHPDAQYKNWSWPMWRIWCDMIIRILLFDFKCHTKLEKSWRNHLKSETNWIVFHSFKELFAYLLSYY